MDMENSIIKLNSTLELWNHFSKTADFKSNEYDKQLLIDIKKGLGFDEKSNIQAAIKTNKTTPQQLLAVLLKSLKPFSLMMSDLLKMFEEANAQYSNSNIQIKFDFDDAKTHLDLDLEHFRVYQKTLIKMVNYELQLELSNPWDDFVYPLEKIIAMDNNNISLGYGPIPNEIKQWMEKYRNEKENWPDSLPLPPKCGIERLDDLIEDIWQIPKAACDLYNSCYESDLGRWDSLSKKSMEFESCFYTDEGDYWIGSFVKLICYFVNRIRSAEQAGDPNLCIKKLGDMLEDYRDKMPFVSVKSDRLLKEFLDLLNLPFWEKRYALYSAWVSTQIISAFEKDKVRFNVIEGTLSYSFGGSTIAIIEHDSIELKLIAELRTPFEGVKGHGRKHNIQPDYSLCINDETEPLNTVLVVECKQYKKPSRRNFIDAVEDYAGGRPIAQIMLVNYTFIPDSFKTKLPKSVPERVPYFDKLVPGDKSCEIFRRAIKNSLPKRVSFSLYKSKVPKDLQSKLIIHMPNGGTIEADSSYTGCEKVFPFICIDNDGFAGKYEEISVPIFQTMKCEYFVQNHSNVRVNGDYSVVLSDNKTFACFRNSSELDPTEIWHVFTIDHLKTSLVDRVFQNFNPIEV